MPTRRPRIVTVRLAVVALVLGALLAVVGVPVAAVAMQHQGRSGPWAGLASPVFGVAEHFHRQGHMVVWARRDFATGTVWEASSGPEEAGWLLAMALATPNAQSVDRDARPPALQTPLDGDEHLVEWWCVGWPLEAATGVERWQPGGIARASALWKPVAVGQAWVVPLRPRWLGLLGNTLFYALLVLTPVVLVRWWRVRRRTKRNQCIACGYELGAGVTVCPECGLAGEG